MRIGLFLVSESRLQAASLALTERALPLLFTGGAFAVIPQRRH